MALHRFLADITINRFEPAVHDRLIPNANRLAGLGIRAADHPNGLVLHSGTLAHIPFAVVQGNGFCHSLFHCRFNLRLLSRFLLVHLYTVLVCISPQNLANIAGSRAHLSSAPQSANGHQNSCRSGRCSQSLRRFSPFVQPSP